jgi:hypothetical protein
MDIYGAKCVAVASASINLWPIQTSLHVLIFAFEVVKWAISLFEMVKCQKAIKCRNYNFMQQVLQERLVLSGF